MLEDHDKSFERSAPPVSLDRDILPSNSTDRPAVNTAPAVGFVMVTVLQPIKNKGRSKNNRMDLFSIFLAGGPVTALNILLPP